MHLRPRCREWLPLATQQLRLRNLARIQGVNITCIPYAGEDIAAEDYELLIYYTLHADKASEAFYTSEALPQRHQQQKWAEICAGDAAWRKSNAQCVCVKVWAQYQPTAQWPSGPNDIEQTAETAPRYERFELYHATRNMKNLAYCLCLPLAFIFTVRS